MRGSATQVRAASSPSPNQCQTSQARTEINSVKNTREACVSRYYKVGISISVQSEHSIHVKMLQ